MPELTYDPTPADQPEFNESEQEALKVGEERMAAEQELLAGKFTDAEELEKAYIELQRKMGAGEQADEAVQNSEPEVEELSPLQSLINQALESEGIEFDVSQFKDMDAAEVARSFLEATASEQDIDLTDTEINDIRDSVGGEQAYGELMSWATQNFPQEAIEGFDELVETGNKYAIQLAVSGLAAMYQEVNGNEPELLTGRGSIEDNSGFRSQAEVIAAMNDPRYDNDPAYRQDVFNKLERSNIDTY